MAALPPTPDGLGHVTALFLPLGHRNSDHVFHRIATLVDIDGGVGLAFKELGVHLTGVVEAKSSRLTRTLDMEWPTPPIVV